jgi:hypothetical protein
MIVEIADINFQFSILVVSVVRLRSLTEVEPFIFSIKKEAVQTDGLFTIKLWLFFIA